MRTVNNTYDIVVKIASAMCSACAHRIKLERVSAKYYNGVVPMWMHIFGVNPIAPWRDDPDPYKRNDTLSCGFNSGWEAVSDIMQPGPEFCRKPNEE